MASNVTADAGIPLRKRRRPAFSCLECRRRKIKCDQENPCGHCTLKRLTCAFSVARAPPPAAAATATSQRRWTTGNLSPPRSNTDHASLYQTENPLAGELPGSFLNRLVIPIASPGTFPVAEAPRLGSRPSVTRTAPVDPYSESTVECLLDRVQRLEQRLSESSNRALVGLELASKTDSAAQPMRQTLSKTRLFGQSHWMTSFLQFYKLFSFLHVAEWEQIHAVVRKCKDLGRAAKAQLPSRWLLLSDFNEYVPPKELADDLVALYFRTFESVYRILHIPSFQKEYTQYWINPQSVSSGFVVKLLLVLAIGTCLYQGHTTHEEADLRTRALSWIYAAQSWISAPFEKSRLNLTGLQVYCLLLLARQTNGVGSDLVWISAGSLLRTAIQMGLHRDPKYFPRMTVLLSELRKRLWATILEFAVQSCIDSGMQPYITFNDFDTPPPSNINDDEIDESTITTPQPKRYTVFTQTSLQITLLKSLCTRLEVVHLINDFRMEPPYDEILRLSAELVTACRESSILTQAYKDPTPIIVDQTSGLRPTAFHHNLLSHLIQRFLLTLHRPSAFKARTDPHFHFSRKISLDSALSIISPATDADFARLCVTGGGLFREIISHGAFTVCLELITQLEEYGDDRTALQRTRASREPIVEAVRGILGLAEKRVMMSENNVNGHLFLSGALAQVDAMEAGSSCEVAIFQSAKRSVDRMCEILRARTSSGPGALESGFHGSQEMDGERSRSSDVEDLGFNFLQDANMDFDFSDSLLLPGWNEDVLI